MRFINARYDTGCFKKRTTLHKAGRVGMSGYLT